ncbi:hypothetical protein OF83DRAFT_1088971 [Amylostereum chailletii]|nr:hypothetical protein OF83DRAFT_1088971 [Amylostereum chailletii]
MNIFNSAEEVLASLHKTGEQVSLPGEGGATGARGVRGGVEVAHGESATTEDQWMARKGGAASRDAGGGEGGKILAYCAKGTIVGGDDDIGVGEGVHDTGDDAANLLGEALQHRKELAMLSCSLQPLQVEVEDGRSGVERMEGPGAKKEVGGLGGRPARSQRWKASRGGWARKGGNWWQRGPIINLHCAIINCMSLALGRGLLGRSLDTEEAHERWEGGGLCQGDNNLHVASREVCGRGCGRWRGITNVDCFLLARLSLSPLHQLLGGGLGGRQDLKQEDVIVADVGGRLLGGKVGGGWPGLPHRRLQRCKLGARWGDVHVGPTPSTRLSTSTSTCNPLAKKNNDLP